VDALHAPRACRLRVGISVKWPLADAPGRALRAARIPIRAPAVAATDRGRRALERATNIRLREPPANASRRRVTPVRGTPRTTG